MRNLLHTIIHPLIALAGMSVAAPVQLVDEAPVSIKRVNANVILVDFGRASFGNIQLIPPANANNPVSVHFGEDLRDGRINRKPPGSVRYAFTQVRLQGAEPVIAAPPADERNTQVNTPNLPPAVLTPPEWGVVLPFRWVEIEGWPGELRPQYIVRKSAFASTWDDSAAAFESSDPMLNRIWDLCRYSIKATTFAGVYVDGDRERIPYEGDAYFNQLSHYATDNDIQMARDTFDWLIKNPTWPTEWAFHMIFMAHADYRHTGDTKWLASRYESLKPKLLLDRAREDGLLVSNEAQTRKNDIVDWPKNERDGYVFKPVNTVINAFHIRSLGLMSEMAAALGKEKGGHGIRRHGGPGTHRFPTGAFQPQQGGLPRWGGHRSHVPTRQPVSAGLWPGASGYAPAVLGAVQKRGMACSVYGGQYLMESLFANDAGTHALDLITARTDRSWRHMVESGTTITWEAWTRNTSPTRTGTTPGAAAPANPAAALRARGPNHLPRLEGGTDPPASRYAFLRQRQNPHPPRPDHDALGKRAVIRYAIDSPGGHERQARTSRFSIFGEVTINDKPAAAKRSGSRWILDEAVSGEVRVQVE